MKKPLSQITKANLGWPDTGTMPNGQWSKGHVTTTLLKFFISWAQQTNLHGQELLQLSLQACLEISKCLEMLYKEGVWIEQRKASQISAHGMQFLNLYRTLAFKSFENGKALYANMPKGHSMDHIFFELHKASATKPHCLNPLIFSVQLFEDYIGRCSRVSRRTSPQQVVKRVLQRCLQASYKYWYEGGYIKDWDQQHGGKRRERERVGDCDVSLWVYIILGRRVYKNLCPPYGQDAFFVHTRNIQNIVFLWEHRVLEENWTNPGATALWSVFGSDGIYINIHIGIHLYTCINLYIYIYIYTYIHTYTYTCEYMKSIYT